MRTLPIAALLLVATCVRAEAQSARDLNDGMPFEIGQTARPLSPAEHRRVDLLVNRSVGLDELARRFGISGDRLNFYEYTDAHGTNTDAKLTVGFGGKGVLLRLIW